MASAQRPILCKRVADMLKGSSFSVGDRLPGERRLAELFETSRTPSREVLCNLESHALCGDLPEERLLSKSKEGRISWEQLRRRRSQTAKRQILDTLALVLPGLAREQAARLSPVAVADLENITARLGEAIVNFDIAAFSRIYIGFFLTLARVSDNDYLILLLEELQAAAHNLDDAGIGLAEARTGFLFEYHVELFNALKSARAEEAQTLAAKCMDAFAAMVLPGEWPGNETTR